jgi:hypothetical protein
MVLIVILAAMIIVTTAAVFIAATRSYRRTAKILDNMATDVTSRDWEI